MSASPHITAVERQARLKRLAAQRFRVVDGAVEQYAVNFSAQEAEEAVMAATAALEERDAKLIAAAKPGDVIEGHGIFIGTYAPTDRYGDSLCRTFNVFAAPEDLPRTSTYTGAVEQIAQLKDWHGYDGANYANDSQIYQALREGTYNGGWIVPAKDILCGYDVEGDYVMPDNLDKLYRSNDSFRDTFKTAAAAFGIGSWYWSSTPASRKDKSCIWASVFAANQRSILKADIGGMSCRPVRLELKPGAGP